MNYVKNGCEISSKLKTCTQSKKPNTNNNNASLVPQYIGKLFNKFCMKWSNTIKINMKYMESSHNYLFIKSLFVSGTNDGVIYFDKLCTLFPNAKRIKFKDEKNYLPFSKNTLMSIYKTIIKPTDDDEYETLSKFESLIKIEFALSSADVSNPLKDFNQMQYYYNKFKKHEWKIKYQTLRKYYDLYHIVSITKIISNAQTERAKLRNMTLRLINNNSNNLLSPTITANNPTFTINTHRRSRTPGTSSRGSITNYQRIRSFDDSCIDESVGRVKRKI